MRNLVTTTISLFLASITGVLYLLEYNTAALIAALTTITTIFGFSSQISSLLTKTEQEKKIDEIQKMLKELTGRKFSQKEIKSKNEFKNDKAELLALDKWKLLDEEFDKVKNLIRIDLEDKRIVIVDEEDFMDQGKFLLNLVGRLYAYRLGLIDSKEATLSEIANKIDSYKLRIEPYTVAHQDLLSKDKGFENKYSIRIEKLSEALEQALEYKT